MKVRIAVSALLFLTASLTSAQALTTAEVGTFLKGYKESGYKFLETMDANTWKVSMKLPDWKYPWPVVVIVIGDPKDTQFLKIGTTVVTTDKEPSSKVMMQLLDKNGDDNNIGALSIHKGEKYFIQYWVNVPLEYAQKEQIAYSFGWVAGYANDMSPILEAQLK